MLIANTTYALQVVETTFKGPTNSNGSRILVKAQCGRMTVSWDHALSSDENHAAAAEAFIRARGWDERGWDERGGVWIMGHKADGTGCVFVYDTRGKAGE